MLEDEDIDEGKKNCEDKDRKERKADSPHFCILTYQGGGRVRRSESR